MDKDALSHQWSHRTTSAADAHICFLGWGIGNICCHIYWNTTKFWTSMLITFHWNLSSKTSVGRGSVWQKELGLGAERAVKILAPPVASEMFEQVPIHWSTVSTSPLIWQWVIVMPGDLWKWHLLGTYYNVRWSRTSKHQFPPTFVIELKAESCEKHHLSSSGMYPFSTIAAFHSPTLEVTT